MLLKDTFWLCWNQDDSCRVIDDAVVHPNDTPRMLNLDDLRRFLPTSLTSGVHSFCARRLITISTLLVLSALHADLLYHEGFDYGGADALLTSASSGAWTTTSVDDDAQYVSAGLTYPGLVTVGGAAKSTTTWGSASRILTQDFPDIDLSAKSEVWMSVLTQAPANVSIGSGAGMGWKMLRNAWGGTVSYGVSKAWSNDVAFTSSFLGSIAGAEYASVVTDTILIVYRFAPGSSGELWLNPVVDGVTVPTIGSGQSLTDSNGNLTEISELYFDFRAHEALYDEIRIGDTLLDVLPYDEPVAPVSPDLLHYEGFNYGASNALLTAASDGSWQTSSPNDDAEYIAVGLSYPGLVTSGGAVRTTTFWGSGSRVLIQDLDDIDLTGNDEVWVSLLAQAPATITQSNGAQFGWSMLRNAWGGRVDYAVGKSWWNTTAFNSSFLGSISGADFASVGTDSILVVYRFALGISGELWLNPVVDGVTMPPIGSGQMLTDSNGNLTEISELFLSYIGYQGVFDELRIGNTWQSVLPYEGAQLPVTSGESTLVYVDFGSAGGAVSDPAWNCVTSYAAGSGKSNLVDYETTTDSGIDLEITMGFVGSDSQGEAVAIDDFHVNAVMDSFYASGSATPTIELTGLNPYKAYTFTFVGSKSLQSDACVARYIVTGADSQIALLNATQNRSSTSMLSGVFPDASGTVTITLSRDRTAESAYFYLGALKLESEELVYLDFGASGGKTADIGWTNVTDEAATGDVIDLVDYYTGGSSGLEMEITSGTAGINTNGAVPVSPVSDFFETAALTDSFWWSGSNAPTMVFRGFNPNREYAFTFVGSRDGVSDDRVTLYTLAGEVSMSIPLNVSNNVSRSASIPRIRPDRNGTFTLTITADTNNTNSLQYFYLGAMEIATADSGYTRLNGVEPLEIVGDQYLAKDGFPVRFWGVNTVAFYPSHETAEAYADHLVELGVNCVRWHHMFRESSDWNWTKDGITTSGDANILITLAQYSGTGMSKESRLLDPEALDRFDYLNSALRRRGIYVMFSNIWKRNYQPGDVDIMPVSSGDDLAWSEAMADLNSRSGSFSHDKRKFLAVFDERVARLNEEFTAKLLNHVNPYTGIRYGDDSQIVAYELTNEYSAEYTMVCAHRFDSGDLMYWHDQLQARWEAYATMAGISSPSSVYSPTGGTEREVWSDFLNNLDEAYVLRMKDQIADLGYDLPVIYSNLWRGNRPYELNASMSDYIENHAYINPNVVDSVEDWVVQAGRTAHQDKPFIIGEFNIREDSSSYAAADDPIRSMLMASSATYGSLQGWSGLIWFAFNHGNRSVDTSGEGQGYGVNVQRDRDIGAMIEDQMMLDHMRTASLIFRRGVFARSTDPIEIVAPNDAWATDYWGLVTQAQPYQAGWQNLSEIRRVIGSVPASQASEGYMVASPSSNPLVSDTGEIYKDTVRKQLSAAAAEAEVFSGYLDANAPAALQHLQIDETDGFASVMLVSEDARNLSESQHLQLSRTYIDTSDADVAGPNLKLSGLLVPVSGQAWKLVTAGSMETLNMSGSDLVLPNTGDWRHAELILEDL